MNLCKIVCFLSLISSTSFANTWSGFKGCGLYQLSGVVRFSKDTPTIVVNEQTLSEMRISFSENDLEKFIFIEGAEIEAKVHLSEPTKGTIGVATKKTLRVRMQNILDPNDTGMKFVSKSECPK